MWNPFNKKKKKGSNANPADPKNMGMLQRIAMKKIEKMSPAEREKLMQKVMTPKNIEKNKDAILAQMTNMLKSGQMTQQQFIEARKRLGI